MRIPRPATPWKPPPRQTNLPTDVLQQIVGHIGGEGSLAQFASLLHESGGAQGILGKLGSVFGRS